MNGLTCNLFLLVSLLLQKAGLKRACQPFEMLAEITRKGQSPSYRWFRFRELVGCPSYRHQYRPLVAALYRNRHVY